MAYQVIARKYRPQRFADVVGQDHVTTTLTNAVKANRIAHAYLFVGPRGTGKTTIARIFAKCLNAEDGPSTDFKPEDPKCLEIAEGRSLDVLEIDGASNRGIEEIRELRETVKYAPASSRYKIYIIDEVHMLTKEAFNALLKTLEEPPAHVKFLFATTEAEKVLPTILSRCQRFDLQRIAPDLIANHLKWIAEQEKVEIDAGALAAISRGADGCMRDAECTLDQLISFCGDKIVEQDVLSMFGLVSHEKIREVTEKIFAADRAAILTLIQDLGKGGKDLPRLVTDLLGFLRNLLVRKLAPASPELLNLTPDEEKAYDAILGSVPTESLMRVIEILTDCEARLRTVISKRILLETSLLQAVDAVDGMSIDELLGKLAEARNQPGPSVPEASQPAKAAPRKARTKKTVAASEPNSPANGQAPPAPSPRARPRKVPESDRELWDQVAGAIGKTNPFVRTYLTRAASVSLAGDTLTLGFASDLLGLVDNPKTRSLIQAQLESFGHSGTKIRFIVQDLQPEEPPRPDPPRTEAPNDTPTPPSKPKTPSREPQPTELDPAEFKNDPLIKEALEIFRGNLVQVTRTKSP